MNAATRASNVQPLPRELEEFLRRTSARRRRQRAFAACGVATSVTIVWAAAWCLVDRIVPLPRELRLAVLLIDIGVTLLLIAPSMVSVFAQRLDFRAAAAEAARRDVNLAQPMLTVVSRLLGPAEHRGSPQMLAQLADEVAAEASRIRAAALLPARAATRPWILAAAMLAAIAIVAAATPTLGMGRLARRYFLPLGATRPVSTTVLQLTPAANSEIVAGDELRLRATVRHPRDADLTIHLRPAGEGWSSFPMTPAPGGAFEFRLPDVRRDIEYYVSGGDATSDVFLARVLLRPAVLELRVRYQYPPYLRLRPQDLNVSDGRLEAPAGTRAELTIRANEALESAAVVIGAAATPTSADPDDPRARLAVIDIARDARFNIRLRSVRGVEDVYRGGVIRAAADRAPLVRLDQPRDGEEIAAPGSPLTVAYQAADDNGIATMSIAVRRADAADAEPKEFATPVYGDARQQRGTRKVDLSSLNLRPGDAFRVEVRATDGAGQTSADGADVQIATGAPPAPSVASPQAPDVAPAPAARFAAPADSPGGAEPAAYRDAADAYFRALAARRVSR